VLFERWCLPHLTESGRHTQPAVGCCCAANGALGVWCWKDCGVVQLVCAAPVGAALVGSPQSVLAIQVCVTKCGQWRLLFCPSQPV
jgi:hypothetical protein